MRRRIRMASIIEKNGIKSLRMGEEDFVAETGDILDLLGFAGSNGTNRILLESHRLHPDFFNLKTGLAGDILEKFSIYRIRAAFVIHPPHGEHPRFQEMMNESNRGGDIRFFSSVPEAEAWISRP